MLDSNHHSVEKLLVEIDAFAGYQCDFDEEKCTPEEYDQHREVCPICIAVSEYNCLAFDVRAAHVRLCEAVENDGRY
jgi:hypothetical protein